MCAHYLPALNNYTGKAFNTEDYNYQEQNITLFTGDVRYLKQVGNQTLSGNLILNDISSNTILGQNSKVKS